MPDYREQFRDTLTSEKHSPLKLSITQYSLSNTYYHLFVENPSLGFLQLSHLYFLLPSHSTYGRAGGLSSSITEISAGPSKKAPGLGHTPGLTPTWVHIPGFPDLVIHPYAHPHFGGHS